MKDEERIAKKVTAEYHLSTNEGNTESKKPHHAEIWMCSLPENSGSTQNGYRPVYISSNNMNNKYSPTVNIIPITSKSKKNLPIHVTLDRKPEYGLSLPSTLLVEQITTVTVSSLHQKIGRITDEKTLKRISNAMSIQFPDVNCLNNI